MYVVTLIGEKLFARQYDDISEAHAQISDFVASGEPSIIIDDLDDLPALDRIEWLDAPYTVEVVD